MNEQEKKRQRIYDRLNAETKPKKNSKITGVSLSIVYKANKKTFYRKKKNGGLNAKNEGFFTALNPLI